MSDQDQQRLTVPVASIDGSSASDSGEQIKVGFTTAEGAHADAIMTTDRATDLMFLIGNALGEARRRCVSDPNVRYLWPIRSWEIAPQQNSQMLTFALRLSTGNELCFQLDRLDAHNLLEGLSAALEVAQNPIVPKNQKH